MVNWFVNFGQCGKTIFLFHAVKKHTMNRCWALFCKYKTEFAANAIDTLIGKQLKRKCHLIYGYVKRYHTSLIIIHIRMKIRDSSNSKTYSHTRAVDKDKISLNFECANDEAGCCFSTDVVVWTDLEPHAINVTCGFGFKPKLPLARMNHSRYSCMQARHPMVVCNSA